ncbi:receptor-like protein 12 [Cucurbita moschata]|uniref:Receptor-like protein 12 n=1 Tax=Cucurbita moschata TaxID=3662 RepID=A0A6J1GLT5_CUCMO|nr:receptor-like protein 12 [Cucurbita moschata]
MDDILDMKILIPTYKTEVIPKCGITSVYIMEISASFSSSYGASYVAVLLTLLFATTHCLSSTHPLCHDEERDALLQFKESFLFDKSANCSHAFPKTASWRVDSRSSDDCCLWRGVECDKTTGHVVGLDLGSDCLYGFLNSNSSLFRLVHLQKLNLALNNFNFSEIPARIQQLSDLMLLNLSGSTFSGQIPAEISKLSNLLALDLSQNIEVSSGERLLKLRNPDFNSFVANFTKLEHLSLSKVDISSKVPDYLANLSSLESLRLSDCGLWGRFPIEIFQFPKLKILEIPYNPNLVGYLPEFNSSNLLEELCLEYSGITGKIPHSIGNQHSLTVFDVAGCNLSGTVPPSLGNLTHLKILVLRSNKFSGQIPSSFKDLTGLNFLHLTSNYFTDATLSWVGMQTKLAYLGLAYISQIKNEGMYGVPSSLCNLSSLIYLDISGNSIGGLLPGCMGNFSSLEVLRLSDNMFHGSIPDTFIGESNLRAIDFRQNQFQGKVPRSLANCQMLENIDLSYNQLTDVFPSWLGALPMLSLLMLQSNRFYGIIKEPKTNYDFPRLRVIDLSYNNLSGDLPLKSISNWNAMKITTPTTKSTYMKANSTCFFFANYAWALEYYYSITIINKGYERSFSKIQEAFTSMDLSSNRFKGEIPDLIGKLKGLHSLNLSHNMLSGQIPSSLGNITQLESLDLSNNRLSGEIPETLAQLTFLSTFDVSQNNLSGLIPEGNQLNNIESSSYEGNVGLCGKPLVKKCGESEAKELSSSTSEEDDEASMFNFGWKIVLIGYSCGVVFGMVAGNYVIKRKEAWFLRIYRVARPKRKMTRRTNH